MNHEFWHNKWEQNQIGFHLPQGHPWLENYWPCADIKAQKILVPLCGKTQDMFWFAQEGASVTGVELSPIACEQFFEENKLSYSKETKGEHTYYVADDLALTIACGDYFKFSESGFTHLYDRAAIIALPEQLRIKYVSHTKSLMAENYSGILISLNYDQNVMSGPPFSVGDQEVQKHWPNAAKLFSENTIKDEPKFQSNGLDAVYESVWLFE